MTPHDESVAEFRWQISRHLRDREGEWELSRRLLESSRLAATVHRLMERIHTIDLKPTVRDALVTALNQGTIHSIHDLSGPALKALTGLPPSKALRALCLYFNVIEEVTSRWPAPSLDSETVSAFVRAGRSPFDLLLTADVPSVLDLGAGDLSFAKELADLYAEPIQRQNRMLILHCVDRLQPQSRLGGPLHPPSEVLQGLRARQDLSFRFLPDQDMCEFDELTRTGKLAVRYAIAACWAPATPTFAYEPTRLSRDVIDRHLRETKGAFHHTQYGSESALQVTHRDRTLLFPPWKFDVRGPLALLDLIARSGHLGLLGAVDAQVFWELLAELLEEERYRPKDQPFTADNVRSIFGEVFEQLSALRLGETIDLATCATMRRSLPRVLQRNPGRETYRFRSVSICRGAVFPNIPASSTARRFSDMVEETPPWMVILVPDQ